MTPEEEALELETEIAKAKAVAKRTAAGAQAPAQTPAPARGGSQSMAALLGFGRGASFGALPTLEGGMKAAQGAALKALVPMGRPFAGLVAGRPVSPQEYDEAARQAVDEVLGVDLDAPVADMYATARDAKRAEQDAAARAWPKTTVAATVAGGAAVPLPGGAAMQTAGALGKAGIRAAQGVGSGAINAAMESRANLIGPSQPNVDGTTPSLVGDVVKGGAIGGIAAPLIGAGIDKGASVLSQALKRNAEEWSLKAMGLRAGISSQLSNLGYESADEARQLGRAALEMDLIPAVGTAADVAKRVSEKKPLYGALIDSALKDADAAAAATGQAFDWDAAGQAASRGLGDLSATARREATRAQRLVQDVATEGAARSGPMTAAQAANPIGAFEAANRLKSNMYEGINYGTDAALATRLERQAAGGLRTSIEEQVARVAGPDAADVLRTGNQGYGVLADVGQLAQQEAGRQLERMTPAERMVKVLAPVAMLSGGAAAGRPDVGLGGALAAWALPAAAPYLPASAARLSNALQTPVPQAVSGLGSLLTTAARQRGAQSIDSQEEDAVARFLKAGL